MRLRGCEGGGIPLRTFVRVVEKAEDGAQPGSGNFGGERREGIGGAQGVESRLVVGGDARGADHLEVGDAPIFLDVETDSNPSLLA